MNRKDMYVDKIFFTEFLAQPLIELAQSIWTIAWYTKIHQEDATELLSGLFLGKKILQMSENIEYYAKPSSIKESIDFMNDFFLERYKADKVRSKRADIIKEINKYLEMENQP